MNNKRDLMAPNTDPTDEELQTVMRDALNSALDRKKSSDAWMKQQLIQEVEKARHFMQSLQA